MPKKTPPVTFETWLRSALVGEELVYHLEVRESATLGRGAALGGDELAKITPDVQLWRSALQASQEGKVALFQRRTATHIEYLAQRISPKGQRFLRRASRLNGPRPTPAFIKRLVGQVRREIAA
jgi:hypothetical protein